MTKRITTTALACSIIALALAAAPARAVDEPIRRGDQLIYPNGLNIPRFLTPVERDFLRDFPLSTEGRGSTPPPTGPLRAAAEYEPMDGILIAWQGGGTLTAILAQMAAQITNAGNANLYVMCDSTSIAATASSAMSAQGANMSRVFTYIVDTDTIWIRDYGPRYVYQGDVRVIVDHVYNRPRPADDLQPHAWSLIKSRPMYEIPLIHGGGNYHLNALGASRATRLIVNENPTLTEAQIISHWLNYQACTTTLHDPFPTFIDATQHIDMWMQIIADNAVMISDWPNNSGSTQDVICDNAASSMAAAGWTVRRLPAFSVSGVHYTYTNVVMCNNVVMVPSYTNATVSPSNAVALAAWQAALPGKTIVQIPSQGIVSLAGVLHCIVKHVPVNLGGVNPVAWLATPRGGQSFDTGQTVAISWISDDDNAVTSADVLLSTDGGATFPTVLVDHVTGSSFNWNVPTNINTARGRFRVLVRDAQDHTDVDQSDSDIVLGVPRVGDITGDGVVDVSDLLAVINFWGPCPGACPPHCAADIAPAGAPAGDCTVNVDDLLLVIGSWG